MEQVDNKYTIQINEQQRKFIENALTCLQDETIIPVDDKEEVDILKGMFNDLPKDYDENTIYDMCDEGPTVAGWANLRADIKKRS